MELLNAVDIIGLSQGIILGILILTNRPSNSRAYVFLGFYLILVGLSTVGSVLEDRGIMEEYPFTYFLPINFSFTIPILFYLYAREISGFVYTKINLRLFMPGILEFLVWLVLFLVAVLSKPLDIESIGFSIFEVLYFLSSLVFMIYYLIKVIRFITKVRKTVEDTFSNLNYKTLSWLRIACILILATFSFPFIDVFSGELYQFELYWVETIVNSVTTLWLAIHGYKQTIILKAQEGNMEPAPAMAKETQKESKVIPLEGERKLFEQVALLVEEKELYKKQELTLAELATEAGIHQKQLSFIINQFSGKNFFNFINGYRVKEAQDLLIDKNYDHLSFLGIAFEAGFNSKATFNATFKKVTGQTPRQYKTSRQSA